MDRFSKLNAVLQCQKSDCGEMVRWAELVENRPKTLVWFAKYLRGGVTELCKTIQGVTKLLRAGNPKETTR